MLIRPASAGMFVESRAVVPFVIGTFNNVPAWYHSLELFHSANANFVTINHCADALKTVNIFIRIHSLVAGSFEGKN
jgi:hypothetical protein